MRVAATVTLSPAAGEFLRASIWRDRHLRRRAVTVLSLLLVAALVAAGIATVQQRTAQSQRRVAIGRQLVAEAEAVRDTDPTTALQLGIAAVRISTGSETRASLVDQLARTRFRATLATRDASSLQETVSDML